MIRSAVSVKASFKKCVTGKNGSLYIEASMVIPLTCLILTALMGIIMMFHGELAEQVKLHKDEISCWSCSSELISMRNYERFIDWIQK